jgi:exonuclease VII small subunit
MKMTPEAMSYQQAFDKLNEIKEKFATNLSNLSIDEVEKMFEEAKQAHQICESRIKKLEELVSAKQER